MTDVPRLSSIPLLISREPPYLIGSGVGHFDLFYCEACFFASDLGRPDKETQLCDFLNQSIHQ
jgi:hypothetical protein